MKARCAAMILAGGAMLAAGSAASAQEPGRIPDATLLNIMRECAKIDDPTARLACYDNNVRAGGSNGGRPSVPGQGPVVSGSGAPNMRGGSSGSVQGFGGESVKTAERFESSSQRGAGPDSVSARVASIKQRQPGIYLVTLEGGAQWLFSESVDRNFRLPRKGDAIELSHAALGSYLMSFDNQEAVRVRRIK
jgi:hypothetical protein